MFKSKEISQHFFSLDAHLWIDGEHAWGAVWVIVFLKQTLTAAMDVAGIIQAKVCNSAIDWEIFKRARDLKLLIGYLQQEWEKQGCYQENMCKIAALM